MITRRSQRAARSDRGIALMVVIWIVGILALQVTLFNSSVRDAIRLAENEEALARGEALTRAAVELTAARLMAREPRERWQPDGRTVDLAYAGASIHLKLTDERSRINLNHADEALLNGLFRVVTGSPLDANRLTARILEWRISDRRRRGVGDHVSTAQRSAQSNSRGSDDQPPDKILLDAADIGRVLGAAPDLVLSLLPHVTIHGPDSKINPLVASETVLRSLPDITPQSLETAIQIRRRSGDAAALEAALANASGRLVFRPGNIFRVEIKVLGGAQLALGGAEIIMATGIDTGAPYRILAWRLPSYSGAISRGVDADKFGDTGGDRDKAKAQ